MSIEAKTKTGTDVFEVVTRTFGDEASVQIEEADIVRFINRAQQEVVLNNYEINQKIMDVPLFVAIDEFDLRTSDIVRINVITVDGSIVPNKAFVDALSAKRSDPGSLFWYLYAGVVRFSKEITSNQKLSFYYNSAPSVVAALTDGLDVPDFSFNQVVDWVLKYCYELDEDVQKMQVKQNDIDRGIQNQRMDVLEQAEFYPTVREVE